MTTSTGPGPVLLSEMPVAMNATLFRACVGRIIGLLLAVALAGCSAIRLGYNQAPELAYWYLDSYVDFTEPQTSQVRADLAALQAWHRQTELPAYVALLERAQRLMPANVTPEQLCELYADARPRVQALTERAEPTLSAVTLTLKPEQLAHLARQLDKRSEKWRDEWLDGTPGERQTLYYKRLLDRAEMMYGRLDSGQRAALRASVAASPFDADLSYRESQRRHVDTLQTLRLIQSGGLGPERTRDEARGLLERALQSPDPIYRKHQERLIQDNCRTYAALHNSTSPGQRTKGLEVLKGYEADLRALTPPRR
jgi:hypothetical protein